MSILNLIHSIFLGVILLTKNEILGKKIRKLRQERGMSLSQMSEMIKKTSSYLSQVERGLAEPSITALREIARALKIPMFYLLLDDQEEDMVVRKENRKVLMLPKSNVAYELLSPDLNRKMELIEFHLEPGATTCEEPLTHRGEECTIVIEGQMEIQIGKKHYLLNKGDSIYYRGEIPHKITSRGEEVLVFISAITPPKF